MEGGVKGEAGEGSDGGERRGGRGKEKREGRGEEGGGGCRGEGGEGRDAMEQWRRGRDGGRGTSDTHSPGLIITPVCPCVLAIICGWLSSFMGSCLCLQAVVFVCGHLFLLAGIRLRERLPAFVAVACSWRWSLCVGSGGVGVVWCWAVGGWWWWVLVAICIAMLLVCHVVVSPCCHCACVVAPACGVRRA